MVILSVLAIFVILLGGSIIIASLPAKLTEADRAMLRDYDGVRSALVRDDLAAARKLAQPFATAYSSRKALAQPAAVIAKSNSLEAARLAFADMSKGAVKLVRKHPEYFIIGCEMETDHCRAKCDPCLTANYGRWVQLDPEIGNPFMGTSSPHCGVVKVNQ